MAGEVVKFEDTGYSASEVIWDDAEGYEVLDTERRGKGRWSEAVTTIVKRTSDGKLFAIEWLEGLTEMQDNTYPDEMHEVVARTETVVVTHYDRV